MEKKLNENDYTAPAYDPNGKFVVVKDCDQYKIYDFMTGRLKSSIKSPFKEIDEDHLYINVGQDSSIYIMNVEYYSGATMYAYNQKGVLQWNKKFESKGYPAVDSKNNRMYFADSEKNLLAIDLKNGEPKWIVEGKYDYIFGLGENGTIYVEWDYSYLAAVDSSSGQRLWITDTHEIPNMIQSHSTNLVANDSGKVFIGQSYSKWKVIGKSTDGNYYQRLFSLNPNGKKAWNIQTTGYIENLYSIDDRLIVANWPNPFTDDYKWKGEILIFNSNNGKLQYKRDFPKKVNALAFNESKNTLFVGSIGKLYAFDYSLK